MVKYILQFKERKKKKIAYSKKNKIAYSNHKLQNKNVI